MIEGRRPISKWPPQYSFVDKHNNFGGCEPNFIQGCGKDRLGNPEDIYTFEVLFNAGWPTSENYDMLKPYNEEDCRKSCLNDCHCAVAIFRNEECWKKLPLSNGWLSTNIIGKALIKEGWMMILGKLVILQFRMQRRMINRR